MLALQEGSAPFGGEADGKHTHLMILTLCTQTQDKHLGIFPCKHIDKQAHKDWQICNFLTGTHKIKYIHPANAKNELNHNKKKLAHKSTYE